ncbi:MAG TPA: glycosyltransferase family 9 protein [Verrucomicrobiales bacterium]|nr:glycosyltransferase family 9 protein [Verrucomicrobiales bacterium]
MLDRLAYFAFRTVETVARMLPSAGAWRMGAGLGLLAYGLSARYRRLVQDNLTIAFGREMDRKQIRKLARKHLMNVGGNFVAGMKIPFMKPADVDKLLELEGIEHVERAVAGGKGVVYALMHMGNWEILSQAAIIAPGSAAGALYQPLHNVPLNAHVLRLRKRTGCTLLNRQEGFHPAVAFVKENKVLGVLSDQRAGESGVWCPFFGRLASTTTLPSLIAKRSGAPMFPVGVITVRPGRWKMVVGEPLPGISRNFSAEQASAVMNERLEQIIRRSPVDWFWVHNRWKTPKPEFLLANAKRGQSLAPGRTAADLQRFEIVIRSPDTLSDACLSIPAVRAIRRGRPDARITVLTPEKLADLWRMEPEVDEVLAAPVNAGVSQSAALLKATGRHYDAGILFTDSKPAAKELAKAGVYHLTGYAGCRKRLLDQVIPPKQKPGPVQHRTREFLRIAWRIGANVEDPSLHNPLPSNAATTGDRIIIGLCPGGEHGTTQRWPLERWAEAAKLVAARERVHWMIFGTAAEAPLGAQLAGLIGGDCTDLTGKTTLAELAIRLRGCRAVVTHDSGPLQLAALLGVPTIAIFGPTEPAHTAPAGGPHTVIRRHVECSPCFLDKCPLDFRCMLEIPPQRVADAVLRHCQTTAATV